MAFYNRIKSGKLAPIGTIMPWGGASQQGQSLANVPAGWIVCNLASVALNAADYPLLAATLGNEYGPFPEEGSGFVNGVNNGIVNLLTILYVANCFVSNVTKGKFYYCITNYITLCLCRL